MTDYIKGKIQGEPPNSDAVTYNDFNYVLGQYLNPENGDNELSRQDRRAMRRILGLSQGQMRRIGKDFNVGGGRHFSSYVQGLRKNHYIKDGKIYTQGEEGYSDEDFGNAKYADSDLKALVEKYNNDVLDWRKNAVITYNPITGRYTTKGFFNSDELVDITDSEAFNQGDRFKNAQLTAYGNAVDNYQNASNIRGASDLFKAIGYEGITREGQSNAITDPDKWTAEEKETAKNDIGKQILAQYKKIASPNGVASWDSSVKADAWWKYLQNIFKDADWIGSLDWDPEGRYAAYSRLNQTNSTGNHIGDKIGLKYGGLLEKAKAYKKGGLIQKAAWGTELLGNGFLGNAADIAVGFIPGLNTVNQVSALIAQKMKKNPKLTWQDIIKDPEVQKTALINGGLDALGPFAKLLKVGKTAVGLYRGANSAAKNYNKVRTAYAAAAKTYGKTWEKSLPYLQRFAQKNKVNITDPKVIAEFERRYPTVVKNMQEGITATEKAAQTAKSAVKMTRREALQGARAANPGIGYWGPTGKKMMAGTLLARASNGVLNSIPSIVPQEEQENNSNPNQTSTITPGSTTGGSVYIPVENYGGASSAVSGRLPGETQEEYWARTTGQVIYNFKQGGILSRLNAKFFKKGGRFIPFNKGGNPVSHFAVYTGDNENLQTFQTTKWGSGELNPATYAADAQGKEAVGDESKKISDATTWKVQGKNNKNQVLDFFKNRGYSNLKIGDKDLSEYNTVQDMQNALKSLGYNITADNYAGLQTMSALDHYFGNTQQSKSMPEPETTPTPKPTPTTPTPTYTPYGQLNKEDYYGKFNNFDTLRNFAQNKNNKDLKFYKIINDFVKKNNFDWDKDQEGIENALHVSGNYHRGRGGDLWDMRQVLNTYAGTQDALGNPDAKKDPDIAARAAGYSNAHVKSLFDKVTLPTSPQRSFTFNVPKIKTYQDLLHMSKI